MSSDLTQHIKSLADNVDDFRTVYDGRMARVQAENSALKDRLEVLEAKGDLPNMSPQKRATASPEHKAFNAFLRGETKTMNSSTAADGAALIPELIANEIIHRAIAKSKLASAVRNTVSPTSDYVRVLGLRGQTATWASESDTRSTSANFRLREIRPTHGELYSVPAVYNWLLQDSQFPVAPMVMDQAVDEFSKSVESAIYNGNGTNKPTGIVATTPVTTSDAASPERAAGAIQYVTTGGDLANDIISLFFSLKPEYRANATFLMSSASLAVVRKLRDSSGSGFLWQHNMNEGIDAPDGLLLGRPVITSEYLPTIGASPRTRGIFCGDFKVGYELVSMGGMTVIVDQVTTKGSTLYYIAQRFGGKLVDNDAIKVLLA